MKELDNNRIEELLPRYCEGRLSEEERLEVEAWIDESEENKRVATQTFALYLAVDTVQVMKKVDTEKALLKVKGKMSDREVRRTVWWEWTQRAAAILFIPLLTLFIWQNWKGDTGEVAEMMEVKTSPGMTTSLTLPDGTIVYLNADSKLRFPVKFAEDVRMVELDGEGYFQVAKNESSPFTVKVGEMKVSVLGTEFNILGYKEYGEIQTTLVNGKVEVSSDKNKKNYTLLPGEQAVFNKKDGIIKVSKVDISYAIAWREGLLRFRDRPLREIMDVVARWYDIEIVYEDIEVKEYLFGCNFNRHETILPLLEVLESTGTVHFKIEDKKIIVSK